MDALQDGFGAELLSARGAFRGVLRPPVVLASHRWCPTPPHLPTVLRGWGVGVGGYPRAVTPPRWSPLRAKPPGRSLSAPPPYTGRAGGWGEDSRAGARGPGRWVWGAARAGTVAGGTGSNATLRCGPQRACTRPPPPRRPRCEQAGGHRVTAEPARTPIPANQTPSCLPGTTGQPRPAARPEPRGRPCRPAAPEAGSDPPPRNASTGHAGTQHGPFQGRRGRCPGRPGADAPDRFSPAPRLQVGPPLAPHTPVPRPLRATDAARGLRAAVLASWPPGWPPLRAAPPRAWSAASSGFAWAARRSRRRLGTAP